MLERKNKTLALFLAICMVVSMLPVTALASTTVEVNDGMTFLAAVEGAVDGDVIRLTGNVEIASMITLGKSITIDLNGHKAGTESGGSFVQVIDDAILTVDGQTDGSEFYGRINLGKAGNNNGNAVLLGGTYSCASGETVLHINGECLNSDVTMSGVTVTSPDDNGIQLNGSGTFNIKDSTITGATAVYVKSGVLTLTNSELTGTMSPANYSYNGNGANATGDAIVIDACNYPGGNPTVIIDGGSFTGTKAAVGYYQYNGGEAEITVKGGTFSDLSGVAYCGNNAVYKLSDDVALTDTLTINTDKAFSIDLNGHNITRANRVVMVERGNVTFTGSGSIMETENDGFGAINIKGSQNAADTDYTTVTVGKNVSLCGWAGILITPYASSGNPHAYGVTVNMNGTIQSPAQTDHTAAGCGIYVNGQIQDTENYPKIIIGEDAVITADNAVAKGTAIYAAGYADWTVNGGTISGDSCIELKAGNMTINGGVFVATAEETTHVTNSDGTSTTGYVLALDENASYGTPRSITVNDGTFYGPVILADDDDVTTNNVGVIAINGGTFNDLSALGYTVAGSDVTYKLTDNVDLGSITTSAIKVPVGQILTIDLNGKTLQATDGVITGASIYLVENNGKLIVKDSSADKTGKLQLTSDRAWSNWYQSTTISNCGKLTVESGTVAAAGTNKCMAYAIDNNSNLRTATTNIDGGTIESTYNAIRCFANNSLAENAAVLNINGGVVKTNGAVSAIYLQQTGASGARAAELNVTGGKIQAPSNAAIYVDRFAACTSDVKIDISGGEFEYATTGAKKGLYSNGEDGFPVVTVTGGSFSDLSGFGYMTSGTYTLTGNAVTDVTVDAGKTIKLDGGSITGNITANGGTVTGKYVSEGVTSYPDVVGPTTTAGAGYRTNNAVFNMAATGITITSGDVTLAGNYGTNGTPITVASGVNFTVPFGVTFQTWGNVTNNGTLNNKGTLEVKAGSFVNNGTIKNEGTISGTIRNNGTFLGNAVTAGSATTSADVKTEVEAAVTAKQEVLTTVNNAATTTVTDDQKTAVNEVAATIQNADNNDLVEKSSNGVVLGLSEETKTAIADVNDAYAKANEIQETATTVDTAVQNDFGITSVTVDNAELSVPTDAEVKQATIEVTTATKTETAIKEAAAAVSGMPAIKEGGVIVAIDITLKVDNTAVQPKAPLVVTIPIPTALADKQVVIAHFKADDTTEIINPTISSGNYVFTLTSLSDVAVLEVENSNAFTLNLVPNQTANGYNVSGGDTVTYYLVLKRTGGTDAISFMDLGINITSDYLTYQDFDPASGAVWDVSASRNGNTLRLEKGIDETAVNPTSTGLTLGTVTFKAESGKTDMTQAPMAMTLDVSSSIEAVGYQNGAALVAAVDTTNVFTYHNITVKFINNNTTEQTYYAKYNDSSLYAGNDYTGTAVTIFADPVTIPSGYRIYAAAPWQTSDGKTPATKGAYTANTDYYAVFKQEFALTFTGSNFTVTTDEGITEISGSYMAAQDIDAKFTVAADTGYKVASVMIGDSALTATAGVYTIQGATITAPITVAVTTQAALTLEDIDVSIVSEAFTHYSAYSGSKTLVKIKMPNGVTGMVIDDTPVYATTGLTGGYDHVVLIDVTGMTATKQAMLDYINGNITYQSTANTALTYDMNANGVANVVYVSDVNAAYDFMTRTTSQMHWSPSDAMLLISNVTGYSNSVATVDQDFVLDENNIATFLYDYANFNRPATSGR